jgi:hypothetical protein
MRLNREALAYLGDLTEKLGTNGQAQPKLSIRFGENPVSITIIIASRVQRTSFVDVCAIGHRHRRKVISICNYKGHCPYANI